MIRNAGMPRISSRIFTGSPALLGGGVTRLGACARSVMDQGGEREDEQGGEDHGGDALAKLAEF